MSYKNWLLYNLPALQKDICEYEIDTRYDTTPIDEQVHS